MDLLAKLIYSLRCLPGVGPKSAQRMAYHLLQHQRSKGIQLASCLQEAMSAIKQCNRCNNYTEHDICAICNNVDKDESLLCIVEGPSDLLAIEQTGIYNGYYYVLMGRLSPLDGIGPEQLSLHKLQNIIKNRKIQEVILALSPTIEGQATVQFIQQILCDYAIKITRPAQGLPSGGELEFLDSNTIGSAFRNRGLLESNLYA